jgi:putative phosphoesterase
MKIVVMSDSHLYELTSEFEELCGNYCRDADLVIHLGDIASSEVLDFLMQYPLEAVYGNMDSYAIRSQLPATRVIRLGSYRIGLTHVLGASTQRPEELRHLFPNVDAILFGHTHQGIQFQANGIFCFNPGSITMGRGNSPRSLGLLHVEERLSAEIIPL